MGGVGTFLFGPFRALSGPFSSTYYYKADSAILLIGILTSFTYVCTISYSRAEKIYQLNSVESESTHTDSAKRRGFYLNGTLVHANREPSQEGSCEPSISHFLKQSTW